MDQHAQNSGDLGGDRAPSLSERRLEERAIRERWPMPAHVRVKVLNRLVGIVDPDRVHDPLPVPGHREVIAAARALIAADRDNLAWVKHEHETRPPEQSNDNFRVDLSPHEGDSPHPPDRPPA